jgi:hypothetical protein
VRQIGYGLHALFEPHYAYLVEHEGQDDGADRAHCQLDNAHCQGVSQDLVKNGVIEEEFEVLQPYPSLLQDTFAWPVVLESHKPAPDGDISKDDDMN